MSNQLDPEEKALRRAVGEVLHYIWDPIGVAGVPQARDEYDGYVGAICALLWQGANVDALARHLERIAEENMGVHGLTDQSDLAARKLVIWRDEITR